MIRAKDAFYDDASPHPSPLSTRASLTRTPREMPVQVMMSANPRVWLATTPRSSNAAREGRRQPPLNVVPSHAFKRSPRPPTSAVERSRLHPSRAATLDGAALRDARETDEVSLDILAKDDVGVLQVTRARARAASLRERPGQLYRKNLASPASRAISSESRNRRNVTIVTPIRPVSRADRPPSRPFTQAISRAVADSGYNITSIITGRTPTPDPTVGFITLHAAPRSCPVPFPSPLEARATGEDVSPRASRRSNPETSRDILLRALARLPEVIDVVDVHPTKDASTETAAMKPNADAGAVRTSDDKEHLGLLYLVHKFDTAPRWDFRRHYDALPRDPYVQNIGIGRFRAYSKYRHFFPSPHAATRAASLGGGGRDAASSGGDASDEFDASTFIDDVHLSALVELPDAKFNQPAGYSFTPRADNAAAAGSDGYYDRAKSERRFARVPREAATLPEFAEIIARFAAYARLDPRYAPRAHVDVGVHLIRIAADVSASDMRGQVVPEGMHQDGFEYVGLGCVGRENVADGWTTRIYLGGRGRSRPDAGTKPVYAHAVEPGEMIFMDDARMWHDADDLAQEDESRPGWMDFIVVTLAADDNVEQDENQDKAEERGGRRTPPVRVHRIDAPYFDRSPR